MKCDAETETTRFNGMNRIFSQHINVESCLRQQKRRISSRKMGWKFKFVKKYANLPSRID